jgi:hypothetical protein
MKNTELKKLTENGILFRQFMIEKGLIPSELIGSLKESDEKIEKAYQEGNIKPLKAVSVDIDDQVMRHMPLSFAIEFKNYIKEKLDINYDVIDKKRIKTIEKVLKKGKISNHEEWEIVSNRVDEIFADNTKGEELKNLNELLLKYEKINGNN